MVFSSVKLIENSVLLKESNRPYFLWVYWRGNLQLVIYKLFMCSPNIPHGLSCP